MIEIEEMKFGYADDCKWVRTDENIVDTFCMLDQLYAQMMGWA